MSMSFQGLTLDKYTILLAFYKSLTATRLRAKRHSLSRDEINQQISQHFKDEIPQRTFNSYMSQLKEDGYIEKDGKNRYKITRAGIEAVKAIR